MLIDTHAHINIMVKPTFDVPLEPYHFELASKIITESEHAHVSPLINVGTSVIESLNCIALATRFPQVYATIGIHPNDCKENWRDDVEQLKIQCSSSARNKIVGIGEIGIDLHYPESNLSRQQDAFRAQIELALEQNLALVIHSRDAAQETLYILDEYRADLKNGIFHCFSYGTDIAHEVKKLGFALGIGGTITYPKNNELREIVKKAALEDIVLETDAPYLPPQNLRGTKNHPLHIKTIAEYISDLKECSFEEVAQKTTQRAQVIFNLHAPS